MRRKKCFITLTPSKELSKKVFAGWDFAIMGEKASSRKQTALTVDLKVKILIKHSFVLS
jgi:hypothetical protein